MSNDDDQKNWFGYGIEYNLNYNISVYHSNIVNYGNEVEGKPAIILQAFHTQKILLDYPLTLEKKEEGIIAMEEYVNIFQNLKEYHFLLVLLFKI